MSDRQRPGFPPPPPFPFIETFFLLPSLVAPLAALWGRMLSPATLIGCGSRRRKPQPANEGSALLAHHTEVMWSGGGLKKSLISVHTVTLATAGWIQSSTGPNWSQLSNSHPVMCFDAFSRGFFGVFFCSEKLLEERKRAPAPLEMQ